MTTDHIQQTQSKNGGLELTRDERFVDNHEDIFSLLDGSQIDPSHFKRRINATLSLLKKAHLTMERAEKTITFQRSRIQTLEKINLIDELTGLYNTQGFEQLLTREIERVKRNHENAGILSFVEIENYDHVRTHHGQKAADACMKLVAQILKDDIRQTDFAGRLNDHELVLLMINTAADKVVERVQKLALRLNKLSLIWKDKEISLHVSISLRSYGMLDNAKDILNSNR